MPNEFMDQTRRGLPPAMICIAERLSCLDAKPDVASLNLTPDMSRFVMKARRPLRPHPRAETEIDACLAFTYGIIERFAKEMQRRGIKPERETYHSGGAWVIRDLIERGLIHPPYLIQTVMGTQTASYPTDEHVIHLLRELPPETVWLGSRIGPFQLPPTTFALLMGGTRASAWRKTFITAAAAILLTTRKR
jgi:3-keto-5-aminohexanoate cleavage enzyme